MKQAIVTTLSALALAFPSMPMRAAETAPPKRVARDTPWQTERLQAFLRNYADLLYGQDFDCTGQNPCRIEVPVTVVPFDVSGDGTLIDYCLARFPKSITFHGTVLTNPRKTIVWTVKPPTFTAASSKNYRFEFHEDYGILLATNPALQITRGGQGDGAGGTDPWTYYMRNWHITKVTALYLPVLKHINTADSNDVGVCATGDPRIVND